MPAPGASFAGPGCSSSERASQLQHTDATIMLGPRLAQSAREWRVPSPEWNREAVAQWKTLGGHFEEGDGLCDFWFIPRRRADLVTLDGLYRKFYAIQVHDAMMRLGMSNPVMHDKIARIIELRKKQSPDPIYYRTAVAVREPDAEGLLVVNNGHDPLPATDGTVGAAAVGRGPVVYRGPIISVDEQANTYTVRVEQTSGPATLRVPVRR